MSYKVPSMFPSYAVVSMSAASSASQSVGNHVEFNTVNYVNLATSALTLSTGVAQANGTVTLTTAGQRWLIITLYSISNTAATQINHTLLWRSGGTPLTDEGGIVQMPIRMMHYGCSGSAMMSYKTSASIAIALDWTALTTGVNVLSKAYFIGLGQ